MTGDWRDYRPAIWLAMLGIAVIILVTPPYIGTALIGAGIGAGVMIFRRRRRTARAAPAPPRSRRRP